MTPPCFDMAFYKDTPKMAKLMFPGKLSIADAKQAIPREKAWKLSDGGGLYLFITPAGSKLWRLKYRFNKKEKTLSLGQYPFVSLADARKSALDAKDKIRIKIDPSNVKKIEAEERERNLFENIANRWFDTFKVNLTTIYTKRVKSNLERDIYPYIGNMIITDIETHHIKQIIKRINDRGTYDVAKRTKQRISTIFRFEGCKFNPADAISDEFMVKQKVVNRASITESQLPDFLKALDNYTGRPETVIALKLLIITFVRPGELRKARWEEFNIEKSEWRIPAERMKMDEEHIIPLSKYAITLLKQLHPFTGRSELLFPSVTNLTKPMSINTLSKVVRKLGFDATAHGFRTTASTILNETGFKWDAIERQLSHAERNKVRGAYNRAQYLPERIEMMNWWSDYVERARDKGNVVEGKFGNF